MSVTALPLDPSAQARILLHYLLEAGEIIGKDMAGCTVIQLVAGDWLLEQLLSCRRAGRNFREARKWTRV